MKNTGSKSLLKCARQFISIYGLLARFIPDQGICYTSRAFEKFCMDEEIRLELTSSRHPQINGQVEWAHSVVMAILLTSGNETDE